MAPSPFNTVCAFFWLLGSLNQSNALYATNAVNAFEIKLTMGAKPFRSLCHHVNFFSSFSAICSPTSLLSSSSSSSSCASSAALSFFLPCSTKGEIGVKGLINSLRCSCSSSNNVFSSVTNALETSA